MFFCCFFGVLLFALEYSNLSVSQSLPRYNIYICLVRIKQEKSHCIRILQTLSQPLLICNFYVCLMRTNMSDQEDKNHAGQQHFCEWLHFIFAYFSKFSLWHQSIFGMQCFCFYHCCKIMIVGNTRQQHCQIMAAALLILMSARLN